MLGQARCEPRQAGSPVGALCRVLTGLEVEDVDRETSRFEFNRPQRCALQVKELDVLCSFDKIKDTMFYHQYVGRGGGCPLGEYVVD